MENPDWLEHSMHVLLEILKHVHSIRVLQKKTLQYNTIITSLVFHRIEANIVTISVLIGGVVQYNYNLLVPIVIIIIIISAMLAKLG